MPRNPVIRLILLFGGVLCLAFGVVVVALSTFTLVAHGFSSEHDEIRNLLGGALLCVAGGLLLRTHRKTYVAPAS